MKRSLYSPPESFSIAPLLALLPVRGKIGKLESLTSSLFARFEKVAALRADLGAEVDRETVKRLTAEEAMLKQVLDWLAVTPEER
jgi:hypothetical protein